MRPPARQNPAAASSCPDRVRRLGPVVAGLVLLLGSTTPGAGQAPAAPAAAAPGLVPSEAGDAVSVFNAAMQAFNRGDWAAAAQGLEQALATVTDEKEKQKLGPVIYTLGAAYFNLPNYDKAAEVFGDFVKRFPQSDKLIEARLGLARASFFRKDWATAAATYQQLEAVPAVREQALAAEGEAFKELNKLDEAIAALEKLIAPDLRSIIQANGGMLLAQLYFEKNLPEKSLGIVAQLHARTSVVENIVALNTLTAKLGDGFAEKKLYQNAIAAYRAVRPHDQVIEFQNARIAAMSKRMEANEMAARGNVQAYGAARTMNAQIKAQQDLAKTLLAEFQKLPDFAPVLLLRQAKCWLDWEKKWESAVVLESLLRKYPTGKEAEIALYSLLVAYADLGQPALCQELCQRYVQDFPDGPNASAVGYLSGATALLSGDAKGAESFFGKMLNAQPDGTYAGQMRYLLGNARFLQGKYDEAAADYRTYLEKYPEGEFAEEVTYRSALVLVFSGKYEEAMGKLSGYLQKYAEGAFAADAGYRLMVCKYAGSLYDEVLRDAAAWRNKFPGAAITGEVMALVGDCYAAQTKPEEAARAYTESYQTATTDEVLNYSLFEASKHLQKLGRWPEVGTMFEQFVRDKPEHPAVVAAMYWIGKARVHEGRVEEAKKFLVETVKRYLNERKRDAVEQLLQQLAELCAKRPRVALAAITAAPVTATVAPGAATPFPATPVPLPPYDAAAELAKYLDPLKAEANPTGQARLLYAEAELARLLKKPEVVKATYADLATRFPPEMLSAVLLAVVGDFLLEKGETDRAQKLYEALKLDFPKSDHLDFADVGLGEIAFAKKDYPTALDFFQEAETHAALKTKEAVVGQAKTLLELQRYDEAKKLFEQVAGMREWRGETTAFAVYSLGEIEARQAHWAEAIAHYQRVFVAYQKYLPWVAKSYLRAAESFDKLGKRKEAIDHLKEMLRNERLAKFPEAEQAKQTLTEWGAAA